MSRRRPRRPGRELQQLLGPAIPSDHARQTLAERYIEQDPARPRNRPWRVLDLGCGTGDSVELFRRRDPAVQWTGVDLEHSAEVDMRTRSDADFVAFDGTRLPFPDASFDLIFCKQVLEHVAYPRPLLAEVRRVLAGDGRFIGSTSQLELFHSRSFWNYTPLGFRAVLEDADMSLLEIRPGIDGPTLIASRMTGMTRKYGDWWGNRSPFNAMLDHLGALQRLDAQTVNATKLLFCGQFAFLAGPAPAPAAPAA